MAPDASFVPPVQQQGQQHQRQQPPVAPPGPTGQLREGEGRVQRLVENPGGGGGGGVAGGAAGGGSLSYGTDGSASAAPLAGLGIDLSGLTGGAGGGSGGGGVGAAGVGGIAPPIPRRRRSPRASSGGGGSSDPTAQAAGPTRGTPAPATTAATTAAAATAANNPPGTAAEEVSFDVDDEETLDFLLDPTTEPSDDLSERLRVLRDRLVADCNDTTSGRLGEYWTWLVDDSGGGTSSSFAPSSQSPHSPSVGRDTLDVATLPPALSGSAGRAHLRACSSLLRLSTGQATSLTLLTLRRTARGVAAGAGVGVPSSDERGGDVDTNAADQDDEEEEGLLADAVRRLLGTRSLLLCCLEVHASQRAARIGCLDELLRIEGDTAHPLRTAAVRFLDGLDGDGVKIGMTADRHQRAGAIYPMLLARATLPARRPTAEEWTPAESLLPSRAGPSTPQSSTHSVGGDGDDDVRHADFGRFVSRYASAATDLALEERVGVVECLVTLMYGTGRFTPDRTLMGCLYRAMGSVHYFVEYDDVAEAAAAVADGGGGGARPAMVDRLRKLAAVACAEGVGLWRATTTTSSGEESADGEEADGDGSGGGGGEKQPWYLTHPMLVGLFPAAAATGGGEGEEAGAAASNAAAMAELDRLRTHLLTSASDTVHLVSSRRLRRKQQRAARRTSRRRDEVTMMLEGDRGTDNNGDMNDEDGGGDDDDEEGMIPQSVALLSFGLLLRLAERSCASAGAPGSGDDGGAEESGVAEFLREASIQCCEVANDDLAAFGFLEGTIRTLVPPPPPPPSLSSPTSASASALLSVARGPSDDDEDDEGENASAVTYASVAREVISALVLGFYTEERVTAASSSADGAIVTTTSLSDVSSRADDVRALCKLAAAVYGRRPSLCVPFWIEWEGYVRSLTSRGRGAGPASPSRADPLCYLLAGAYDLASLAVEHHRRRRYSSDRRYYGGMDDTSAAVSDARFVLGRLAPFLTLLSSLCCDADVASYVLSHMSPPTVLPASFVGAAVSTCSTLGVLLPPRSDGVAHNTEQSMADYGDAVGWAELALSSLESIARIGGRDTRMHLRSAIDDDADAEGSRSGGDGAAWAGGQMVDLGGEAHAPATATTNGPFLLYRVVTSGPTEALGSHALSLLDALLLVSSGGKEGGGGDEVGVADFELDPWLVQASRCLHSNGGFGKLLAQPRQQHRPRRANRIVTRRHDGGTASAEEAALNLITTLSVHAGGVFLRAGRGQGRRQMALPPPSSVHGAPPPTVATTLAEEDRRRRTYRLILESVLEGALAACNVLAGTNQGGGEEAPFTTSAATTSSSSSPLVVTLAAVRAVNTTLSLVRPWCFHGEKSRDDAAATAGRDGDGEEFVVSSARTIRDGLVARLSSSSDLGQAVASCASLPVSSALRGSISSYGATASLIHRTRAAAAGGSRGGKYGAWASIVMADGDEDGRGRPPPRLRVVAHARRLVTDVTLVDLTLGVLGGTAAVGADANATAAASWRVKLVTGLAREAVRLLLMWAKCAYDISTSPRPPPGRGGGHGDEPDVGLISLVGLLAGAALPPSPSLLPPSTSGGGSGEEDGTLMGTTATNKFALIWPRDVTYLTLLSRYLHMDVITSYPDLPTTATTELVLHCFRVYHGVENAHQQGGLQGQNNPTYHALNGASQLHTALLSVLPDRDVIDADATNGATANVDVGEEEQYLSKNRVVGGMLRILTMSITEEPKLAGAILGVTATAPMPSTQLLDQMLKTMAKTRYIFASIKCDASESSGINAVRFKETLNLDISTMVATFISSMWVHFRSLVPFSSSCQGVGDASVGNGKLKDHHDPLVFAVDYFLQRENFFPALTDSLLAIVPEMASFSREHACDICGPDDNLGRTFTLATRSSALRMISATLCILSVEVYTASCRVGSLGGSLGGSGFATGGDKSSLLPKPIVDFLQRVSQDEDADFLSNACVEFDGVVLAAEGVSAVNIALKVAGWDGMPLSAFLAPTLQSSPNSAERDGGNIGDVSVFADIDFATDVLRGLRSICCLRDGNSSVGLDRALVSCKASHALAFAQADLIRSWREFVQIALSSFLPQSCGTSTGGTKLQSREEGRNVSSPGDRDPSVVFPSTPTMRQRSGGDDFSTFRFASPDATPRVSRGSDTGSIIVFSPSFLMQHILSTLSSLGEASTSTAFASLASSTIEKGSVTYASAEVALELSKVLLAGLNCEPNRDDGIKPTDWPGCSHDLLPKLHSVSSRLFALTGPGLPTPGSGVEVGGTVRSTGSIHRERAYTLGCRLRLHLLSSAILLVRAQNAAKGTTALSSDEVDARIGFVDLACNTLHLLKYHPGEHPLNTAHYTYNYNDTTSSSNNEALELLWTSVGLLTGLLPTSSCGFSYASEFAGSLRRGGGLTSMLSHLSAASEMATVALRKGDTNRIRFYSSSIIASRSLHDSIETIAGIVQFANSASAVCYREIYSLLLDDGLLFRSFAENPLLQFSCHKWHSWTIDPDGEIRDFRGYILLPGNEKLVGHHDDVVNSSKVMKLARDDPIHAIWRMMLRTVACLVGGARTTNHVQIGRLDRASKYLDAAIDFVCAYDFAILSAVQILGHCSVSNLTADSVTVCSRYTTNGLREASGCLSLLSELCHDASRSQFESVCPSLSSALLNASLEAMRSLSTFLGAAGAARELFELVARCRQLETGEGMNGSSSTGTFGEGYSRSPTADQRAALQKLYLHPLLASGIPNARHEAITNAHYVSSCCVCMTVEDCNLNTPLPSSKDSTAPGRIRGEKESGMMSLETFRSNVNNEFTMQIEGLVSTCLCHSLTVLTRAHPTISSFVPFDEKEAVVFDAARMVRPGTIIGVRPLAGSPAITGSVDNVFANTSASGASFLFMLPKRQIAQYVPFARVLTSNVAGRAWDVEYLDITSAEARRVEHKVSYSRLAGIVDSSRRKQILVYAPAKKSPSEAMSSEASIGHLTLALRWCRQQVNNSRVDKEIMGCVAELAAALLGKEICLYADLAVEKVKTGEEVKQVNDQLLDLFVGDVVGGGFRDQCKTEAPLRSVVDEKLWGLLLMRLQSQLVAAKNERVLALETHEACSPRKKWGGRRRRSPRRGLA